MFIAIVFYGVFISFLLSFAYDLTDKDENDITCYLIFFESADFSPGAEWKAGVVSKQKS